MVRFFLSLLFTQALVGCGGTGSDESPVPPSAGPTVPPPTASAWDGRFVGVVKIGEVELYGDALFTADGLVRLYVGGPYVPSGLVQQTRPESSAQFVGNLEVHGDQAFGSGVIIGQGCAAHTLVRFCGETASGEISAALDSGDIQGEIQVTTNEGDETWVLDLQPWRNYYVLSASLKDVAGQYQEELAEFAPDGDTIMTVDQAGQLFFQSAHSGCTGNGTLAPHLDGAFNVYDVTLTIDSCNGQYAYLNGEFEGLATTSASAYWDYDSLLRIWLSKRDAASSQAAVTMSGRPQ